MKTRQADRIRAFLGAQIFFNNRQTTVDCQIRNISASGAKLVVSSTVSVPEEFELQIPQKGRSYRCRLCWRIGESAGVEFLDGRQREIPSEALSNRVRELESENEILRTKVLELRELLATFSTPNATDPIRVGEQQH